MWLAHTVPIIMCFSRILWWKWLWVISVSYLKKRFCAIFFFKWRFDSPSPETVKQKSRLVLLLERGIRGRCGVPAHSCLLSYPLTSSRLLCWLTAQSEALLQKRSSSKRSHAESCPVLPQWDEYPSGDLPVEPKAWPFAVFEATLIGYVDSRVSWKASAAVVSYLDTSLPYQVPLIHLVTSIPQNSLSDFFHTPFTGVHFPILWRTHHDIEERRIRD